MPKSPRTPEQRDRDRDRMRERRKDPVVREQQAKYSRDHRKRIGLEESRRRSREGQQKFCMDGTPKVYFVQATLTGPIKIGFTTKRMAGRLRELQGANHEELEILAVVPGTKENELALHRRFAHLRIRGEWFHPAKELLEFVWALSATTAW